jgi:predicted phage terminase large subunit-like protein
LELALERKIYKKSLYEFYKVAFCQLHPGTTYDENWHAIYLCEVLQAEVERIIRKESRTKDLIINVPFRSSKSMLTTVIFPVWCWTLDPSLKFITTSYSGDLALEHSRRSKDLINTVWFQRLYGATIKLKADAQAASHYETLQTGMRKAVGTGGQITGSGADIIIIDDPQNPKKAASEVERMNTIEFYDHTLFSRLNDPDIGVRIVIQQRLHEQDLTGHLMDPKHGRPEDHQHICIPGELDMQVLSPPELAEKYVDGLFWPSRFSKATLAAYKKALGLLQFAGQVGQRPVPPEGNLFKRAWFSVIKPELIVRDSTVSPIHFFIDTAYTEDEQERNDPSGILTVFERNNILYVVNFVEVWLEFPELIKFIKKYVMLNGYTMHSSVWIEPKASGKSIVQQLKADSEGIRLNVMEIEGEWIKDDKVTRANGISPIAQSGRIAIIDGPWNDLYINYLTSFPKAMHDEAVDVTVYAANKLLSIEDFLSALV